MLIYDKKRFSIIGLIEYLNSLEKKSSVLITYKGKDLKVTYDAINDNVLKIETNEDFPFAHDIMKDCLNYKNICKTDFETSVLAWKEANILDLLGTINRLETHRITFSACENFEELYAIDCIEHFWDVVNELLEEYDSDQVKFFIKVD